MGIVEREKKKIEINFCQENICSFFWPFSTKTAITFRRQLQTTWNLHHWILHSKGYDFDWSFAHNGWDMTFQTSVQSYLKNWPEINLIHHENWLHLMTSLNHAITNQFSTGAIEYIWSLSLNILIILIFN